MQMAREQLKNEIEAVQQSLETANSHFENASDPDLLRQIRAYES